MPIELLFRPEAEADLDSIDDFIAQHSPERAYAFIQGIRRRCGTLKHFPEMGSERPDLRPGLRLFSFERRVVVAYRIIGPTVEIVRIFYRGRDFETLLSQLE